MKPLQGLCAHRFKRFSKQLHLTAQKTIFFLLLHVLLLLFFAVMDLNFRLISYLLLLSNCMADYYRAGTCFQKSLDVNLNQLMLVYLP